MVELGKTPLSVRHVKLVMQYLVKLKAYMGIVPAIQNLNNFWEWGSKKSRESFVFKVHKEIEQLGLGEIGVAPNLLWPVIPPWILPTPKVDMSVLKQIKEQKEPKYSCLVEQALGINWQGYVQIYTDGSKDLDSGKAGCAFYSPQQDVLCYKILPKEVSVFTAEIICVTAGRSLKSEASGHLLRLSCCTVLS